MADKSKGPVIGLIMLLLAAIGAAAWGFMELQKEKQVSARLQEEKEQLEKSEKINKKEITRLNEFIEELKIQREQQQAKLQENEKKITAIKDELAIEKREKEGALSAIEKSKEELSSLKAAKVRADSELKVAQETLTGLKEQLAVLEKAKEAFVQKPKEPETMQQKEKSRDVQLEKIVVASSGSASEATAVSSQTQSASVQAPGEGRVLVVNKEYDFVVVNIGQKENINVSDALEVFRNNKKLGEMKVEEVKDTMSVATPNNKDLIRQIKEDDRVVRKI